MGVSRVSCGLSIFRKPVSLLLDLVTGRGLGVCSVPVIRLISRCLSCIHHVRSRSVCITDRFLRVTTELICLGAISLLPIRRRTSRLGERLANRLVRCQSYGLVTRGLSRHASNFSRFIQRPVGVRASPACAEMRSKTRLLETCLTTTNEGLHGLPPPVRTFHRVITGGVISINSGVHSVCGGFTDINDGHGFASLFSSTRSHSSVMTAFLTILRLTGSGGIVIDNSKNSADVRLLSTSFKSAISRR